MVRLLLCADVGKRGLPEMKQLRITERVHSVAGTTGQVSAPVELGEPWWSSQAVQAGAMRYVGRDVVMEGWSER